jgi:predicted ribosome quality control (RQC) complex YloA/Tae2 family protein
MEVTLKINKSVEQNAEAYFEMSKKHKKKIPGIKKTIELYEEKLEHVEFKDVKSVRAQKSKKKEWFEKFRWFYSSDGFFIIAGRDATTNDIIIKKYTDDNDIVFHTELAGSPFVIIKNPEKTEIPDLTIQEAAVFCASFSKSWKAGRGTAEVYHIMPDQVTKQAPAGLGALPKGSFMITGKRNYINAALNIGICIHEGKIMSGPLGAIKKYCDKEKKPFIEIIPGNDKLSDVGKKLQKILGGELDEIIRALPSECTIKKAR